MRIDTKARSAIAAVLDIAIHEVESPVRLGDIAIRQHISVSYLEQIFRKLRQVGVIVSIRGPGGGYRLNRRLSRISVADIIAAVDDQTFGGDRYDTSVRRHGTVTRVTDRLWCRIDDRLLDYLRSVTLESLLASIYGVSQSAERSTPVVTVPHIEPRPPGQEDLPAAVA